jgi:hypothetical protein
MKSNGYDGVYTLRDDTGTEVDENLALPGGYTLTGGQAPRKENSSGRVWTACGREFFPHVFDLKWHRNDS